MRLEATGVSPFQIVKPIVEKQESRALDGDLSASELESLKDPQFKAFFQRVIEQPELALQLQSLVNPSSTLEPQEQQTHSITPIEGFVVKTASVGGTSTKVFLNFCHSDGIPAPPSTSTADILTILHINEQATSEQMPSDSEKVQFKFPMSLHGPSHAKDANNRACLVYDVCVATSAYNRTLLKHQFIPNPESSTASNDVNKGASDGAVYRGIMIEFGMCLVERRSEVVLGRGYTMPKMRVKGVLGVHTVRRIKAGISEIEEVAVKNDALDLKLRDVEFFIDAGVQCIKLKMTHESVEDVGVEVESMRAIVTHGKIVREIPFKSPVDISRCSAVWIWAVKELVIRLG